jgi:hypothetical protein
MLLDGHTIELRIDLIVILGKAAGHDLVLANAKRQQHGLFEPFIDLPSVAHRFGNALLARVEQFDRLEHRGFDFRVDVGGVDFSSIFERLFDNLLKVCHE